MKLETISTKGDMTTVKAVTVTQHLSKKELANSEQSMGAVLIQTKQELAKALAAQILAGHLAKFSIHDDANEEQVIIGVTAFVIPPDKMKPPKQIEVPEKRLIVPA